MYEDGSLVTLARNKSHGEGEDAVTLHQGMCGLIVQQKRRKPDGNHEYVVDFGAYGQWYCTHNELSGDDKEAGWDGDPVRSTTGRWEPVRTQDPVQDFLQELNLVANSSDDGEEESEEEEQEIRLVSYDKREKSSLTRSVEDDIERRVRELQEGKY